ncbi:alpha/beta fold hydrolase [Motiliproteus sp. MSK22-1]|uniref:alpha/beta hydrolase family protein n=1 Tax=Motiliproteus sp. MSK22-1 TaxID=1897630 RepID=UPI0009761C79|nr:alpha/beta fold hydrolase [Motiliproteus sp. MSK22-1]OMH31719.1 hypothetical protein BGP75_16485 [Motiliproteus sp. MSK22-1]
MSKKRWFHSGVIMICSLLACGLLLNPYRMVYGSSEYKAPGQSLHSNVGIREMTFVDLHRDRVLESYIWFPVAVSQTDEYKINKVFRGFKAVRNADITGEKLPLILLLHGTSGNRNNLHWLATTLASQGAVVVAANHPGSTTGDASPETVIRMWDQPADIRFLIQDIIKSDIGRKIDQAKIAVIGFSLGGYTSMALAGAQLEFERFPQFCRHNDIGACRYFSEVLIALDHDFYSKANQVQKDVRVTAAVAIAPGFTESMTEDSVAQLAAPVLMIAAEQDNQIPVISHARPLSHKVTEYYEIAEAGHFSFLPECLPGAIELLAEEGDEFVCTEPGQKSRARIHQQVRRRVTDFLKAQGLLEARN